MRQGDGSVLTVSGTSIQFLVGPQQDDDAPCILKRTIFPGMSIIMHSHDVVEVVFVLSGNFEILIGGAGTMRWSNVSAGTLIEIPGNTRHAFRNRSQEPAINMVFTTSKHGRYFQEVGRPAAFEESIRPPTSSEIQHLLKTAERVGYWLATPEENASVGIRVPLFTRQKCSDASAAAMIADP
jgi:quercetin dioxygenase-like cupin family protein